MGMGVGTKTRGWGQGGIGEKSDGNGWKRGQIPIPVQLFTYKHNCWVHGNFTKDNQGQSVLKTATGK